MLLIVYEAFLPKVFRKEKQKYKQTKENIQR